MREFKRREELDRRSMKVSKLYPEIAARLRKDIPGVVYIGHRPDGKYTVYAAHNDKGEYFRGGVVVVSESG